MKRRKYIYVYCILVCGIIICVMPEDRQLWKNILPQGRLMNTCKYNIRCSTNKRKKVIENTSHDDIDMKKVIQKYAWKWRCNIQQTPRPSESLYLKVECESIPKYKSERKHLNSGNIISRQSERLNKCDVYVKVKVNIVKKYQIMSKWKYKWTSKFIMKIILVIFNEPQGQVKVYILK